jgi:hypothetical protein
MYSRNYFIRTQNERNVTAQKIKYHVIYSELKEFVEKVYSLNARDLRTNIHQRQSCLIATARPRHDIYR